MPNIKSAKKRVKQTAKRWECNVARKSAIKTAINKVLDAVEKKDVPRAKKLLQDVEVQCSRAKSKGVIHRNTASRKVSRLAEKIKKMEQSL